MNYFAEMMSDDSQDSTPRPDPSCPVTWIKRSAVSIGYFATDAADGRKMDGLLYVPDTDGVDELDVRYRSRVLAIDKAVGRACCFGLAMAAGITAGRWVYNENASSINTMFDHAMASEGSGYALFVGSVAALDIAVFNGLRHRFDAKTKQREIDRNKVESATFLPNIAIRISIPISTPWSPGRDRDALEPYIVSQYVNGDDETVPRLNLRPPGSHNRLALVSFTDFVNKLIGEHPNPWPIISQAAVLAGDLKDYERRINAAAFTQIFSEFMRSETRQEALLIKEMRQATIDTIEEHLQRNHQLLTDLLNTADTARALYNQQAAEKNIFSDFDRLYGEKYAAVYDHYGPGTSHVIAVILDKIRRQPLDGDMPSAKLAESVNLLRELDQLASDFSVNDDKEESYTKITQKYPGLALPPYSRLSSYLFDV